MRAHPLAPLGANTPKYLASQKFRKRTQANANERNAAQTFKMARKDSNSSRSVGRKLAGNNAPSTVDLAEVVAEWETLPAVLRAALSQWSVQAQGRRLPQRNIAPNANAPNVAGAGTTPHSSFIK
jgi:hypothetical protein